jgi:hypothetical protein
MSKGAYLPFGIPACKHCGTARDYDRPLTKGGSRCSVCKECRRKQINTNRSGSGGNSRKVAIEPPAPPGAAFVFRPKPKLKPVSMDAVRRAVLLANERQIPLRKALVIEGVLRV